ncbi:MAG: methionine synthase [Actinobacteria bacterium]|nr:methionine synthase [Actinomycetota bacterium]
MEDWEPALTATAIGSLPHTDAEKACAMTLQHLTEAPVWPQLPRLSFRENMYAQYSEGLPGVVVDEERRKVFCDTERDLIPEMEVVYQAYLDGDISMARIGEEYASGLYRMAERLAQEERSYRLLKGQVTGPVSFGLTVLDGKNRPILYNDQLAEVMVRLLNLKARWMEGFLRGTGRARGVLVFFDEPYLVSVGSALVSVDRGRVVDSLRLCGEGLTCLTGVHCCGNTDWTYLFEAGVDVVSFDAYGYMDSMALYPEELCRFLEGGGALAWGLVPNDARVDEETADSLARRFEEGVALLASRGVDADLLRERALLTPSCGLEGVSEAQAEKAYRLTSELSSLLRG